ncbi:MAG: hypothetical protein GWP14_07800 [Actinobacteria bacterium]|nr:hypothetical protein [Actinomycetota bacterium]
MTQANSNGKTATKLIAALLGAVVVLQSVFVGLLISHIQDRSIHSDQQSVSLAAYQADREHFQRSLEEIKITLRDIQRRLEQTRAETDPPSGNRPQVSSNSKMTGGFLC